MAWHLAGLLRAAATAPLRYLSVDPTFGRAVGETVRQLFVSGTSLTAPFVVTLLVLGVVLDFVAGVLEPLVRALALLGLTGGQGGVIAHGISLGLLVGLVLLVGLIAESGPTTGVERRLGKAMEAVPGLGSMYSSVDRMSDVMLESDVQSFRDVKLVEFPHADIYSLAFLTSEIDDGEDGMQVLFVPLAPNPVMGGFMVCVPDHRVRDVDMSVDEAFQAIVTSGVAMTGASHLSGE